MLDNILDVVIDTTLEFLAKYNTVIFFTTYLTMITIHVIWTYLGL